MSISTLTNTIILYSALRSSGRCFAVLLFCTMTIKTLILNQINVRWGKTCKEWNPAASTSNTTSVEFAEQTEGVTGHFLCVSVWGLCCHLTPHGGFPPLKPLTGCVYQSKHRGQDGNASLLPSARRKQRRRALELCRPEHSTCLSSLCDCLRLPGHMFLCFGRYLAPDLCAHSWSRLSFLFLLTALRTCVKHLTSQRGHRKKTPAPRYSPRPPSSSDNNCSILLSIYTRLCFPGKYFLPRLAANLPQRDTAQKRLRTPL